MKLINLNEVVEVLTSIGYTEVGAKLIYTHKVQECIRLDMSMSIDTRSIKHYYLELKDTDYISDIDDEVLGVYGNLIMVNRPIKYKLK